MTPFKNFKTYLPSALKHLSGCHFKILWKKRNVILSFQSKCMATGDYLDSSRTIKEFLQIEAA
jgi:hypothetical protein